MSKAVNYRFKPSAPKDLGKFTFAPKTKRTPLISCQGCSSKVSGYKGRCNRPVAGHGCSSCRYLGLVCYIQGAYLAPCPKDKIRQTHLRPPKCDQCEAGAHKCDWKRPCDHCDNNGLDCTGDSRGCFWRGVESDNYYGYYLTLGAGPGGIDDPYPTPGEDWEMPDDYHLQYQEWKEAGGLAPARAQPPPPPPLPPPASPPGLLPAPPPGLPLPSEDSLQEYQQLLEVVGQAIRSGIPGNLAAIMQRLDNDFRNLIPINESQAARDIGFYLQQQTTVFSRKNNDLMERVTVNVPPNDAHSSKTDEASKLNPGPQENDNWIAPIKNIVRVPVDRALSPGPGRPQFWIPWNVKSGDIQVADNSNVYPFDHPEFISTTIVQHNPFMFHPVEDGQSALASIPFWRVWDNAVMFHNQRECQAENYSTNACGNVTFTGCEDQTHSGDGMPICERCEQESRTRFIQAFEPLVMNMRQYLCWECTNGTYPILDHLAGTGVKVYCQVPPGNSLPDFKSESIVSTGLSQMVGGYYGDPLEITGCSCAMKLFGRRICSPHRLHYLLEIDNRVSRMREYCRSVYGKMVCPHCRKNAGIDNYGFQGERGGENNPFVAWVCLQCNGYVFHKKSKEAIPAKHLAVIYDPNAPIPYNPTYADKANATEALVNAARGG
ncbi:hypothetical protein F4776DRAFT_656791 [Hypoxylon sp. NC0597]|nr:hypothetical protein F4776DRAFT_656791 [Hypoxylon sp. NC0597]